VSKKDGCQDVVFTFEEDGVIVLGSGEADVAEDLLKDLVPSSSALLSLGANPHLPGRHMVSS
jgi:hypothetical protein